MVWTISSGTKMTSKAVSYYSYQNDVKVVEVVVQFCRIGEIDTMREKYTAEIYFECKWHDKDLVDKYDPDVNWNPHIYIENAIQLTKEDIKYSVYKPYDNMSIITESRHLKGDPNLNNS